MTFKSRKIFHLRFNSLWYKLLKCNSIISNFICAFYTVLNILIYLPHPVYSLTSHVDCSWITTALTEFCIWNMMHAIAPKVEIDKVVRTRDFAQIASTSVSSRMLNNNIKEKCEQKTFRLPVFSFSISLIFY